MASDNVPLRNRATVNYMLVEGYLYAYGGNVLL